MATIVRFGVLGFILSLFLVGVYDFLKNVEPNACEMTYMFELPQYLKVNLQPNVQLQFPRYGLYLYGEGAYAEELKSSNFKLQGIPVLFIPGNAGSYKQVRSLGSVALRLGQSLRHNFHFNFFSLDFSDELSGLYGPLLVSQTEFTKICIQHILSMYGHLHVTKRPTTVLLVGHSMGGLVARALFTLPGFDPKTVDTILTQATPHRMPVMALDPVTMDFYNNVNSYWLINGSQRLENIVTVSTGGGFRDILVRDGLTILDSLANDENSLSLSTMAMPSAWVSTDHLCHVWCRQVVVATARALFDIVDKNTKQIAVNPLVRKKVFQHHLQKNPGLTQYQASFDLMTKVDPVGRWDNVKKKVWRHWMPTLDRMRYTAVAVPKVKGKTYEFVAISNVEASGWIGVCTLPEKESQCKEIGNFGYRGNMLPPFKSGLKVVHLDWDKLDSFSHAIVVTAKSAKPVVAVGELYEIKKRFVVHNTTSFAHFLWNFPSSIWTQQVILNATRPRAVFYNISLRGLELPLQAYTLHIDCIQCNESLSQGGNIENTVVKFHIPWSDQHTYTVIPHNSNGSVSLKLQSGRPEEQASYPSVQLYIMPLCTYRISISISWSELFGQFTRFYGTYLPAYLVIQVLMALSWQLIMLDEKGEVPSFTESHTRWAQPYRVGIVAMGVRLLVNYPEDDNFAKLLGLPPDDMQAMQQESIWYQALPVLLYLVAYSFIGLWGYVIHFYFAVIGRIIGPVWIRGQSVPKLASFVHYFQYVLLLIGLVAAGFMCGTLGLIVAYIVFVLRALSSYITARENSKSTAEARVWNRYNLNVTFSLLILMLLILNAPPFIIWAHNFSLDNLALTTDLSRTTGAILCVVAILLTYVDMSLMFNELTSVMGAVAYICCILLVLFGTVSIYRISYFINATLMTIALPSSLIVARRSEPQAAPIYDTSSKAKSE